MLQLGKKIIANQARDFLDKMGYKVIRKNLDDVAPFEDMQRFVSPGGSPTIFDVGANIGQTTTLIKEYFPHATVHSFEPSPASFKILRANHSDRPGLNLWNLGVGADDSVLTFNENQDPQLSSFLRPAEMCCGDTKHTTEVQVVSLDKFCEDHSIPRIDILKLDTQGYELQVFKGAERMMQERRIGLIYFELIVTEHYVGQPHYWELLKFMDEHEFELASFYFPHFQGDRVSWTNLLYVNPHAFA